MDKLTVSETYTNNGFTIKVYDINSYRELDEMTQERIQIRLTSIDPSCPSRATLMGYLEDATQLEVAFSGTTPVAMLIAGSFEDDTDEHICPDNHPAFRQSVRASAPAPKKDGFFKRMLKATQKREKEIKKEADDVEEAIEEVQDKLKDLKKVCSSRVNGGRSRVNRKTRRSKGKRRNTKRR